MMGVIILVSTTPKAIWAVAVPAKGTSEGSASAMILGIEMLLSLIHI